MVGAGTYCGKGGVGGLRGAERDGREGREGREGRVGGERAGEGQESKEKIGRLTFSLGAAPQGGRRIPVYRHACSFRYVHSYSCLPGHVCLYVFIHVGTLMMFIRAACRIVMKVCTYGLTLAPTRICTCVIYVNIYLSMHKVMLRHHVLCCRILVASHSILFCCTDAAKISKFICLASHHIIPLHIVFAYMYTHIYIYTFIYIYIHIRLR